MVVVVVDSTGILVFMFLHLKSKVLGPFCSSFPPPLLKQDSHLGTTLNGGRGSMKTPRYRLKTYLSYNLPNYFKLRWNLRFGVSNLDFFLFLIDLGKATVFLLQHVSRGNTTNATRLKLTTDLRRLIFQRMSNAIHR